MGGSGDSQNSNKAFAEKYGFTYPLLCDQMAKLPKAMGVESSRWCVLIGTDGKIEKIWGKETKVDAKSIFETVLSEA